MSVEATCLRAWEAAHRVTVSLYRLTSRFPDGERTGLGAELRRAGSLVCASIAEGFGRGDRGELVRYLRLARGSAGSLQYGLLLAHDLRLVDPGAQARLVMQVVGVRRLLGEVIRSLAV